jgi:hypothetical protein
MVMVGADAHKRTHTFVAVDEVGRKLGEKTVRATSEGHLEAVAWASKWSEGPGPWRTVGMSPAGWKATCSAPARLLFV